MVLLNESDFPARNGLLQFFPEGRTGGYWGEVPPPVLPDEKPVPLHTKHGNGSVCDKEPALPSPYRS